MSGKDELVSQTPMQMDPYRVKGSDFPLKDVDDATGQSGAHGTAVGGDELIKDSVNQCGPRHIEDGGPGESGAGTPTSWQGGGGRSSTVAAAFPVKTNKGEANQEGTGSGARESINLQTGMIEAKGYKSTKVKEVPESSVSIG